MNDNGGQPLTECPDCPTAAALRFMGFKVSLFGIPEAAALTLRTAAGQSMQAAPTLHIAAPDVQQQ
jgi:hypothetical protein